MDLHALIHEEEDGSYWAEVRELPGCFASGFSLAEVIEALQEAILMCLPESEQKPQNAGRQGRSVRLDELKLVTA
jgi:predicted RNase H-like HicB family nuclease